jgi:hypothetical protein
LQDVLLSPWLCMFLFMLPNLFISSISHSIVINSVS